MAKTDKEDLSKIRGHLSDAEGRISQLEDSVAKLQSELKNCMTANTKMAKKLNDLETIFNIEWAQRVPTKPLPQGA